MGFGEILIFTGDQAHPLPEIFAALGLRAIVLLQALGHIIGFANVDQGTHSIVRIRAHQEIHTGATALWPLHQLGQFGAGPRQGMAGPVHNLGSQKTVRTAINKEQTDAASMAHAVVSISDWRTSSSKALSSAGGCHLRTSIFPVTAAEIRAERLSRSRPTNSSAALVSPWISATAFCRYSTISSCSCSGGVLIQILRIFCIESLRRAAPFTNDSACSMVLSLCNASSRNSGKIRSMAGRSMINEDAITKS